MKATVLFSCSLTMVFLPSVTSDSCKTYNLSSNLQHFVHEGEPFTVSCLLGSKLNIELPQYNLTWHRAGNHTPVSKDRYSRIQQRKSSIWFLPALLRDSGSYECIRRNATHCSRSYFYLVVFSKNNGSCFNEKFAISQDVFTSQSAKIMCPDLDSFRAETHPILWYKDCKMIKDERFQRLKDYILINNTTMEDQGSYTCKMPYYDTGKKYSISRDIRLMVTESPPNQPPKIWFPRNHSIEIELGSSVVVDCNASGAEQYQVFWKVNGSYINSYNKNNFFEIYEKEVLLDRQPFCTVRLNILEVSKREYEHPLVCHALNHFGHVTAYVKLKDKVSDGKIYDAYVLSLKANGKGHVYCLDNFVLKILPDVLERQCGYNLFIVGRDDLPGQAVIHIADDTIKHSRRLIIILEPELSSCSRLEETSEQQIAIYNALVCYGIKVILIEMGKLQDYTNMPESIQYIKQKHGAIRWKKDFAEKSLSADTTFWKNVRYQMPPRRSASHSEFHLLPQISTNSATTISR